MSTADPTIEDLAEALLALADTPAGTTALRLALSTREAIDGVRRVSAPLTLAVTDRFARPGRCPHINIAVAEDEADVTCAACGKRLNPTAVLVRMAREQTQWERSLRALEEARTSFEARSRCECQHCGKMTRIR